MHTVNFDFTERKTFFSTAIAPNDFINRGEDALRRLARPLAVKEVTLMLGYPAAGIEPVRRIATDLGGGNWRIEDLRIPLAGRWDVRVDILVNDFEKVVLEEKVELPHAP